MARRVPRRAARRDQQCPCAHRNGFCCQLAGAFEVGQWDIQSGEQPGVDRAELDHRPVVGASGPDRELDVAGVLPVAQPSIVKRVEHELTGEPEEIEGACSIIGDERSSGREVLPRHDLECLVVEVLGRSVTGDEPIERLIDVAQLFVGVAGLAELVASRVGQWRDPIADARIGVVAQPVRCLHDVSICIVDDQPGGVVRHHHSVASRAAAGTGCEDPRTIESAGCTGSVARISISISRSVAGGPSRVMMPEAPGIAIDHMEYGFGVDRVIEHLYD